MSSDFHWTIPGSSGATLCLKERSPLCARLKAAAHGRGSMEQPSVFITFVGPQDYVRPVEKRSGL
jgi:hypothetical protein